MSAQIAFPPPVRKPVNGTTRFRHSGFVESQAIGEIGVLSARLRAARNRQRPNRGQPLGELLVGHSLVSPGELETALAEARASKHRLGEVLVDRKLISADILRLVLAEQFGYPIVDLKRLAPDAAALLRLPPEVCKKHRAIPVATVDDRLVVAISDPSCSRTVRVVGFAAHAPVEFVVAAGADIDRAIARFHGANDLEDVFAGAEEAGVPVEEGEDGIVTLRDIEQGRGDKPVVRLLNHILLEAIRRNASDVHLRPEARGVGVLFRIDGQLVEVRTVSRSLLSPLVARIKVVGRMDVANRFVPQDGSARVADGDRMIDLRISVIPTIKGESVTIRVLNASTRTPSIDDLGFSPEDAQTLHECLNRSSGMLLVTGPTGAGKSTTLYAALRDVVKRNVTVMSVEDPVERQMDGVEQIPINKATGFTFPLALRSILRHDPNAIMIGEIRDRETARLALESALTGHLVLTTLHTNSAAAAIPRFLDMGIEPYVVGSTLSLIVAQRLIRLNCSHCLTSEKVPEQVRKTLGLTAHERFAHGIGCGHCGGTGYGGRQVVYEMLRVTETIRAAALAAASTDELHRIAVAEGMRPLDEQAIELARTRRTSIAEVYRVRLG